jgi:hypothetical protein
MNSKIPYPVFMWPSLDKNRSEYVSLLEKTKNKQKYDLKEVIVWKGPSIDISYGNDIPEKLMNNDE